MSARPSTSLAAGAPLRLAGLSVALLASQGCLPLEDALCQPCTAGGCGAGLVCASSTEGMVCVPRGETAAACRLSPPDAGPADSGPVDTGVAIDAGSIPDAGPSPCPTSTVGVTWLASAHAGLCFTQTEVTVEQFELCTTSSCTSEFTYNLYSPPTLRGFCNYDRPGFTDRPMNCINQEGAADFCRFAGGRLPSRAEWYAEASASGTRTYPWGDEAPDCTRAVMDDGRPLPGCDTNDLFSPCSRPAGYSSSGLCDMSGNVWEITADVDRGQQVMCGGGLATNPADADFLRADACKAEAGTQDDYGFRCVTDFVR